MRDRRCRSDRNVVVRIAAHLPHLLAIDLSVTRLAAGVVDDAGRLIVRDRVATPSRHVWPTLARLVGRVIAAAPEGARPARCGVACPGPIDRVVGGTASALLPEWKGFPLRAQLEEVAGIPVAIDSVGRAFASAEAWCGRGAGLRDFVALLVGDSVDGGVVSAGRLLDGRTGNVGQFGHLVVEPEGRSCSCGGVGCLDAYVSARAIESETNRPLRRTPPSVVETTGILLARAVASIAAIVDTTHVFSSPDRSPPPSVSRCSTRWPASSRCAAGWRISSGSR